MKTVLLRSLSCLVILTLLFPTAATRPPQTPQPPASAAVEAVTVTITPYTFPSDSPILGAVTLSSTTPVSIPIRLGGFSGLMYEGLTPEGAHQFLSHTDRGPNAEPSDFITTTAGDERPFVLPGFAPQWVRFTLHPGAGQINVVEQITLTRNGANLTGLPNRPYGSPGLAYDDENPIDLWGNALITDAFGIDSEGIVKAADGTYWMVDEYRSALYNFSDTGALINRYVPLGSNQAISTGIEALPAVYAQRKVNRGFEGIAYAKGKIYAFIQSALDNPDVANDANAGEGKNARILEFDLTTKTVTGEYVYVMDHKKTKIGDAIAIGPYDMLVLEHRAWDNRNENIYRISLVGATNLLQYTNPTTCTVEQLGVGANPTLAQAGITPVRKTVLVDLDATAGYPTGSSQYDKPEGLAIVDADTLAVIFDNDFSLAADWLALNGSAPVISPTVASTLLLLDFSTPFLSTGLGEIRGTITNQLTGLAMAGVTVTAGDRSAVTGANGRYVIGNLAPGASYMVSATSNGYVSKTHPTAVAIGLVGNAPDIFLSPSSDAARDAYFLDKAKYGNKEPATDSASAATALATGYKTDDGNLAWLPGDPATGTLTTIAETLRGQYGYAIGVASTVPFNHATPAGFVSHNVNRNNYSQIADEIILSVKPELVIGGGYSTTTYMPPMNTTYISLTTGNTDYTRVITRRTGVDGGAALIAAADAISLTHGEKLFGLFGNSGGSFDYHVVISSTGSPSITRGSLENPTLAEITTATLKTLSQDDDGFFVMLEQGDIDWTNHANDFENMIGGIWDLDAAVRAAEAYVDLPGGPGWNDTLLMVTADHSNSYLRLPQPLGKGQLPQQVWNDANSNGRVDDGEWRYPNGEVTYRTTNHTNELVTFWARGQGATLFNNYAGLWYSDTNIIDNSQVYTVMLTAAGQGAKHILLFIGDGMNIQHEVAGSRYLYGANFGLAWHDWGQLSNGWAGYCSTWDVTTYNKYADAQGRTRYVSPGAPASLGANDATLGYNPGGTVVPGVNLSLYLSMIYLPLIRR